MSDDLYWRLTPVETGALLDEIVALESRRERSRDLRAGLVAASIYNTTPRKPGSPNARKVYQPEDFVGREHTEPTIVPRGEMIRQLVMFADQHNKRLRVKH
jgi:hypothetical protein